MSHSQSENFSRFNVIIMRIETLSQSQFDFLSRSEWSAFVSLSLCVCVRERERESKPTLHFFLFLQGQKQSGGSGGQGGDKSEDKVS